MTITELQQRAHDMALGKGWWPYPADAAGRLRLSPETLATKLFRVTNEVSEAGECLAAQHMAIWYQKDGKPEGLPIELADIVIRVADLAGALGINLDQAIQEKLVYKAQRTHRHGGKTI